FVALENQRYAAAKPSKHLPEFEPDVTTSDHDQMFWKLLNLHQTSVGEISHCLEAGNWRLHRPCAGVDKNSFAFENVVSRLNLMRRNKLSVPPEESQIGAFCNTALVAGAKALDYLVLPRQNRGEIDSHFFSQHAPARSVACIMRHLRRCHHRLRRCAAGIHAGSTELIPFH